MLYVSFFVIVIIDASKDFIIIRKKRVYGEVFIVFEDFFEGWFQGRSEYL